MLRYIFIMRLKFVILLLITICSAAASTLKPFKSDGCSSFPDGTLAENELWLSCCYQHDLTYWQGGSYAQRKQADVDLKNCVAEVGEPTVAKLMLAGVRVGGSPYWPTAFRWAYGWPWLRGYKVITAEEQTQIDQQLQQLEPIKAE